MLLWVLSPQRPWFCLCVLCCTCACVGMAPALVQASASAGAVPVVLDGQVLGRVPAASVAAIAAELRRHKVKGTQGVRTPPPPAPAEAD
jgi:hypothetical protein